MDTAGMMHWLNSLGNYAVATTNYRGFGLSEGSPNQEVVVRDGLAFLELILKKTNRKPSDVILVGESIGSGVACQVALALEKEGSPVDRLILLVPFESMMNIAQEKIPIIPMGLVLTNTYESQKAAPEISSPTTIIAAKLDALIPPYHAEKLSRAFPSLSSYIEIDKAEHTNLRKFPQFHEVFAKACASPTPATKSLPPSSPEA